MLKRECYRRELTPGTTSSRECLRAANVLQKPWGKRQVGWEKHVSEQGSTNICCKGPDSKYFRLWRLLGLCRYSLSLLLKLESSHKVRVNQWMNRRDCAPPKHFIYENKGCRMDLAHWLHSADHGIWGSLQNRSVGTCKGKRGCGF